MLTILNDSHIGVNRSAGTTPTSQVELRNYIRAEFKRLLPAEGDLMVLGDLFDTNNVPLGEVFETFKILNTWLTENPDSRFYNVAGNHDLSKTTTVLSSFQFLGNLLSMTHPDQYMHIEKPCDTYYGYVIPHLRNQELFDHELSKVPECDYLFLHVNVDNHFAAQSDQSLNISLQQLQEVKAKTVVCGHEHHFREIAKVVLPGNQVASSVADWAGEEDKSYLTLDNGKLSRHTCSRKSEQFVDVNWKELKVTDHKFVRVSGKASAEEVSSAITAINKLRAEHPAFVITNAVSTVSEDGSTTEIFSKSLESVQRFSVIDALKKILDKDELEVLEKL